jgi:hypothetical protein
MVGFANAARICVFCDSFVTHWADDATAACPKYHIFEIEKSSIGAVFGAFVRQEARQCLSLSVKAHDVAEPSAQKW